MTEAKSGWSREQNIVFENALAAYPEDFVDRWKKIAGDVPVKTLEEIKNHYELLLDDVSRIESGCVPLPCYNSFSDCSVSHISDKRTGKKSGISAAINGERNDGGKFTSSDQDRRKGIAWTDDEHKSIIVGLQSLQYNIKLNVCFDIYL
ncbi:transcription factor SRM1-like [Nicotiana tabacum]|uniref:Protein RADIALIS-like 6 n=1 Tax=Nicotiana tabacum TaxID=4097 RepID=A0A1S4AXI0_TOBAC|nr:PREDICTED: protein RADIALIS-like 6 [Nicotiana tabacum]